jgi:hypothetical protein
MSTKAQAVATVASWDENAYDEDITVEGAPKTSKASIKYSYDGDIAGESAAELLMVYVGEEAEYVGLERVTATIDGRKGSFVISAVGGFKGGVASSSWNVVAGSGTGELEGLTGTGTFEAPSGHKATVTFDYELG